MVIGLAIVLIAAVVLGMVGLIAYEMSGRPRSEWHHALKEWQQLTGAVLGLLGAAGVFILGASIQAEHDRQRALETQYAIGRGLALETERMAQALRAGQLMAQSLSFDQSEEDARQCRLFMSELARYLPPTTPVYSAVLADLAQFGDLNLSLFVRFYGVYGDILRALQQSHVNACVPATSQADVGYASTLINGALGFYAEIASRYGIAPIADVQLIEQKMSETPTLPAVEPTASATTAN